MEGIAKLLNLDQGKRGNSGFSSAAIANCRASALKMRMATIETERTRLRRFRANDTENMILLESDADVMRFTPSRVPLPLEQTEKRLKSIIEKEQSYAPLGVWAVELKKSGAFAGWFMLLPTEFEFPELGFVPLKTRRPRH